MEWLYPTGPISEKMQSMFSLERFREARRSDFESLTPREREVLALVATGMSNPQVALELGISRATVQNHRAVIRQKLGIGSGADYLKFALAYDLIRFEP